MKFKSAEEAQIPLWGKNKYSYTLFVAEYHIFAIVTCNDRLNFDKFLLYLHNKVTVLRAIAAPNNNLDKFQETWIFFSYFPLFLVVNGFYINKYIYIFCNSARKLSLVYHLVFSHQL